MGRATIFLRQNTLRKEPNIIILAVLKENLSLSALKGDPSLCSAWLLNRLTELFLETIPRELTFLATARYDYLLY